MLISKCDLPQTISINICKKEMIHQMFLRCQATENKMHTVSNYLIKHHDKYILENHYQNIPTSWEWRRYQ